MTGSDIVTETDAGVFHIAFARPAKKNALTLAMYEGLCAALATASSDPNIRVVVLRGEGGSFTAGNDLADFMQNPPSSSDSPVGRFLEALVRFAKPIVAAVEGPAIGVGTTMLLHCDLVYAATGSRLQMPFVPLGLSPEAGSSYLLPRLAGHPRAAELLLLGEPFGPELAREIGLVLEVLAPDQLHARVRERAAAIAALPPASVRLTKQLMRAPIVAALGDALTAESTAFFERLRSPEAAEAMQAFFMKRKPDFSRFT